MRAPLTPRELADLAGADPSEIEEYVKRGLLDPDGDGGLDDLDVLRLRLLMHYRSLGRTVDDLAEAIHTKSRDVLYGDLLWDTDDELVSAEEAAEESGLELEDVRSLLRALGLSGEIPRGDVKFLEAARGLVDGGIPLAMVVDVARVYGDTLGRLAQTEVRMIRDFVTETGRSSLLKDREQSQRLAAVQELIAPILEPLLLTIHQRHLLQASVREAIADLEAAERGTERETLEATIVFVDLASFTALAQIHGDEVAAGVLGRFDELVRTLLEEHSGTVVKQIGDAFMLVFSEELAAVRFAVGLGELAQREPNFPALRSGIHSGPVLYRVGDYVGNTVNLAARIAAMATANEVLVTQAVAEAARSNGFRVADAGRHELAGIEGDVPLWRVEWRAVHREPERDPVCGMAVGAEPVARLAYEGVEYVFCSPTCLRRFLEDPQRYVAGDRGSKPEL